MPITSVGYDGPVTDAQWPVFSWNLVGGYSVVGVGDFQVTSTTGDRTVAVADGTAVGAGVMDVGSSLANVSIPSVGAGSRWDLIALRRNWSTNETTVVRVEGTAAKAIPSGRQTAVGTQADQPLALVRVAAGSAVIQEVVDLRVWVGDGGAFAKDELVLSFLDGLGTHVRIGDVLWFRQLDNLNVPTWRRLMVSEDTGWVSVGGLNGGWIPNALDPPRYRVRNGELLLVGRVSAVANATNVAFTLPAGARPDVDTPVLAGEVGGTFVTRTMTVAANGNVTIFKGGATGTPVSELSLAVVRPMPIAI